MSTKEKMKNGVANEVINEVIGLLSDGEKTKVDVLRELKKREKDDDFRAAFGSIEIDVPV